MQAFCVSQGKTKKEESEEYSFCNYINVRGGGKTFQAIFVVWNTSVCAVSLQHSIACSLGCSEPAATMSIFSIPCLVKKVFRLKLLQTSIFACFFPRLLDRSAYCHYSWGKSGEFSPTPSFFSIFFMFNVLALHTAYRLSEIIFLRGKLYNLIVELRLFHRCLLDYFLTTVIWVGLYEKKLTFFHTHAGA